MKKIFLLPVALVLLFASCNKSTKTTTEESAKEESAKIESDTVATAKGATTGADRDEHGCIGSAGQSWSVIKNECVQVFNTGVKFTAFGTNKDETMASYVILSDDKKKVEIFLPNTFLPSGTTILDAKDKITLFENTKDAVKITLKEGSYLISVKDKVIFAQKQSKTEGLGKLLN